MQFFILFSFENMLGKLLECGRMYKQNIFLNNFFNFKKIVFFFKILEKKFGFFFKLLEKTEYF